MCALEQRKNNFIYLKKKEKKTAKTKQKRKEIRKNISLWFSVFWRTFENLKIKKERTVLRRTENQPNFAVSFIYYSIHIWFSEKKKLFILWECVEWESVFSLNIRKSNWNICSEHFWNCVITKETNPLNSVTHTDQLKIVQMLVFQNIENWWKKYSKSRYGWKIFHLSSKINQSKGWSLWYFRYWINTFWALQ